MLAIDIDITSITLICITLLSITLTSITLIIIMSPLLSKEGKGSASKEEAKEPASKHVRHVVLLVRHSGDRGHHHHLRRCGAFCSVFNAIFKKGCDGLPGDAGEEGAHHPRYHQNDYHPHYHPYDYHHYPMPCLETQQKNA